MCCVSWRESHRLLLEYIRRPRTRRSRSTNLRALKRESKVTLRRGCIALCYISFRWWLSREVQRLTVNRSLAIANRDHGRASDDAVCVVRVPSTLVSTVGFTARARARARAPNDELRWSREALPRENDREGNPGVRRLCRTDPSRGTGRDPRVFSSATDSASLIGFPGCSLLPYAEEKEIAERKRSTRSSCGEEARGVEVSRDGRSAARLCGEEEKERGEEKEPRGAFLPPHRPGMPPPPPPPLPLPRLF